MSDIINIFDENNLLWSKTYINCMQEKNDNLDSIIEEYLQIIKNDNMKYTNSEDEYNKKLEELNLCIENKNYLNKFTELSNIGILKEELNIIKILVKYTLQNKSLNCLFYEKCLTLLFELSELLRIRYNQTPFEHNANYRKKSNTNYKDCQGIYRSSYKFCLNTHNCVAYYSKNKICQYDHFVHNLLSADITSLLSFIKKNYVVGNTIMHSKDILKSINTLNYVVEHMYTELLNKTDNIK